MTNEKKRREDTYIAIPQSEYSHLYNGQYSQLTSLQKSADPRGESSAYLEATLKSHYPKVYVDMIKNDYIRTSTDQTTQAIKDTDRASEKQ